MTITNLFLFVPFMGLQIFGGVWIIKEGFVMGIPFLFVPVGMIFLLNALCGIVSSIRD